METEHPPTEAILHVLRRMADGWRFRRLEGLHVSHWLFGAGVSEMERVNAATAHGLAKRGLVIWARGFPTSTADLAAKGPGIADG